MRSPDVKSPAPAVAAGSGAEADWLASKSSSTDSADRDGAQALIEALAGYDLARTAILIADDHVRSFGIDMHDLPVILETRCRAIRLALDGRAA